MKGISALGHVAISIKINILEDSFATIVYNALIFYMKLFSNFRQYTVVWESSVHAGYYKLVFACEITNLESLTQVSTTLKKEKLFNLQYDIQLY